MFESDKFREIKDHVNNISHTNYIKPATIKT